MNRLTLFRAPAGRWAARVTAAALSLALLPAAHAGLFDDDEARRAILDLRAQLQQMQQAQEQQRARQAASDAQAAEQAALLRRSVLELNTQIEQLRAELSRMRGDNEQLARDVAELQRKQRDIVAGVDDRIRKLEPVKVSVDGQEFMADPDEKRQFETAMEAFRGGDFTAAGRAFSAFNQRWPGSGYKPSALFWLGNAQYGAKQYKEAITSFRALLASAPQHPKAPEALLSVANTHVELKDVKSARAVLNELIKAYPQTEAAAVAKERLSTLRG